MLQRSLDVSEDLRCDLYGYDAETACSCNDFRAPKISLMPRWLSPSKQKVLKAVLRGSVLLPYHAASETASSLARVNTFRFATAYSANPQLASAVVECINSVKSQLGPTRHPHFCQLLVTSDAYGSHVEYAPSVKHAD